MTTVLIVLSSHDRIGESTITSGNWLDSFATPYFLFRDEAIRLVVASPDGGAAPIDPRGAREGSMTDPVRRLKADPEAQRAIAETVPLDEIDPDEYDGLFYPGSYPVLTDLPTHPASIRAIEVADAASRPLALVCHSPACLIHARRPDGSPVVEGRHVTGFSRAEEHGVGMDQYVPMIAESALVAAGGLYTSGPEWLPYVVTDGNLVTGQNPSSPAGVARAMLERL